VGRRADGAGRPRTYAGRVRWWERVGAWSDTRRLAVDATGTAVLGLIVVPAASTLLGFYGGPALSLWSLAMVVPLAWRRVRPTASAVAVFSVALAHMLVGIPLILPADLLVLVSLYSVTVHGPQWAYRTASAGSLVGSALFALTIGMDGYGATDAAFLGFVVALLCVTVFAVALVRRSRRVAIDALVDRARRLEIERDQQAQIATAAERARIAREMHDIVAHSLSVIIAQADGGRYAAQSDPAAATRALTTIAETGRAALTDMRRLLGVLRPTTPEPAPAPGAGGTGGASPAADGAAQAAPPSASGGLTPQPGVDDIATLVAQVRESGVRASLVRMGTPRLLPPGTGLAVYRICQESLTNVLKHAGPSVTVTVLLQWAAASLVLEVSDDGRGAAAESDGRGHGVLGMRERAVMLGGSLTVGPRPGGGYRVRAEIPIPPLRQEDTP